MLFNTLDKKDTFWLIMGSAMIVLFFSFDLYFPLGVAGGVPYVAVVLLTLWMKRDEYVLLSGVIATALTIAGFFLSEPHSEFTIVLINRFLACFGIWVAVFVIYKFKQSEKDREKKAKELERLNSQLKRSNKDLEHFAYVASHDLQEPLRKVDSFIGMLEKRCREDLDQKARGYIDRSRAAVSRMKRLINDLLEFSRVGRKKDLSQKVDCKVLLDEVQENLEAKVTETGTCIETNGLPTLRGDGAMLSQLFQNLILNAIKFQKKGVSPVIKVDGREDKNKGYLFSVSDNGKGMDKVDNKVFEIFQRMEHDRSFDGSGMGLAICKRIVEHHGGKIWYDTEIDKGTTFYFNLPTR